MYFFSGLGTLLLCLLFFFEIEISISLSKRIGTPLFVQFQQKCTKKDKPFETAPQQLSAGIHGCMERSDSHRASDWKKGAHFGTSCFNKGHL